MAEALPSSSRMVMICCCRSTLQRDGPSEPRLGRSIPGVCPGSLLDSHPGPSRGLLCLCSDLFLTPHLTPPDPKLGFHSSHEVTCGAVGGQPHTLGQGAKGQGDAGPLTRLDPGSEVTRHRAVSRREKGRQPARRGRGALAGLGEETGQEGHGAGLKCHRAGVVVPGRRAGGRRCWSSTVIRSGNSASTSNGNSMAHCAGPDTPHTTSLPPPGARSPSLFPGSASRDRPAPTAGSAAGDPVLFGPIATLRRCHGNPAFFSAQGTHRTESPPHTLALLEWQEGELDSAPSPQHQSHTPHPLLLESHSEGRQGHADGHGFIVGKLGDRDPVHTPQSSLPVTSEPLSTVSFPCASRPLPNLMSVLLSGQSFP